MNIAILGTGNVGGALATRWSHHGHTIHLAVRDTRHFKGSSLLNNPRTQALPVRDAVQQSDVVLIAVPPVTIASMLPAMGDVGGKVLIDATNAVRQAPEPYKTVYHYLAANTAAELVKCFNSTGFENMLNPVYNGIAIDMFMAGDSAKAKDIAKTLALDAGFSDCIDFGNSGNVELLEQFALVWINLAHVQGHGRGIAFKLLRR